MTKKILLTRTVMISALAILLSSGLVVYAATTLFTQTVPAQTFTTPLLSGCSSLGDIGANSTIEGSPTMLEMLCSGGVPAFTTAGTTSSSYTVIPTFTSPSGWSMAIIPFGTLCNQNSETMLISGSAIALTGGTGYQYCMSSSSASNFTSFSITWSV